MEYKQIDKRSYKLHLIKTDKFKTITVRCIFKEKINKEEITIRNFLFELFVQSDVFRCFFAVGTHLVI